MSTLAPLAPYNSEGWLDSVESSDKLDRIDQTTTELRVNMAMLSGDVRATLNRLDGHDSTAQDVERRLRSLENRSSAIPNIGTIIAIISICLALYAAFTR